MTLRDWIAADTTKTAEPLTREMLDATFEAIKNRPPESPYDHPHSPKCRALDSHDLYDCNCGTRDWLISIGFGSYVLNRRPKRKPLP